MIKNIIVFIFTILIISCYDDKDFLLKSKYYEIKIIIDKDSLIKRIEYINKSNNIVNRVDSIENDFLKVYFFNNSKWELCYDGYVKVSLENNKLHYKGWGVKLCNKMNLKNTEYVYINEYVMNDFLDNSMEQYISISKENGQIDTVNSFYYVITLQRNDSIFFNLSTLSKNNQFNVRFDKKLIYFNFENIDTLRLQEGLNRLSKAQLKKYPKAIIQVFYIKDSAKVHAPMEMNFDTLHKLPEEIKISNSAPIMKSSTKNIVK